MAGFIAIFVRSVLTSPVSAATSSSWLTMYRPNDFVTLADNFLKIADVSDLKVVDQVLVKFGGDLMKIGENLNAVSADFSQIGQDFEALADTSDEIKLDQAFIKYSGDLLKLATDFVKLDTSLAGLGTDFLKINEVLHLKLESGPTPEITQLVQAVGTFAGDKGQPESATTPPGGDTSQPPFLTTPQHG